MSSRSPIPDSYWVRPGRLLAGEYPRDKSDATSRPKLRKLLEAGITFFLDLTEEEEGLEPYDLLLAEEALAQGRSVEHRRLPIPDLSTPDRIEMREILDTLDQALADGHVVYVHCWGGIGRTGAVVGCHLVRHGLSGEEALREIVRLREGIPDAYKSSPETDAQRRMVRDWLEGW